MTQPLQFGRSFLAACQQLVADTDNANLQALVAASNSTLLASASTAGSYLNAPGARTDLTAANMAALLETLQALQTWLTTPNASTGNVAPIDQLYLAL